MIPRRQLTRLRLDEIDREALWLNGDEPDGRALLSDPSSRSGGDQLSLFLFFWSRVKHRVQQRAGRFLRALQLRFDDGQRHVGLAEEHVVRTLRLRARMRRPSLADAPFRRRVSASPPSSGRARVEGDDLAEVLAGGGARVRRANVVEGEAALIEEGP